MLSGMSERRSPGLGALLTRLLVAGLGLVAVPPLEAEAREREARIEAREDGDDELDQALALAARPVEPGTDRHAFAYLLEHLDGFDALRTAATAALSSRVEVRRAVAEALIRVFPLVGDDVLVDHLSRDEDVQVRFAAVRAAHARRASGGDHDVLERLQDDPNPFVARAATLALLGAPPLRR
jgi:HEAT repeat protein